MDSAAKVVYDELLEKAGTDANLFSCFSEFTAVNQRAISREGQEVDGFSF